MRIKKKKVFVRVELGERNYKKKSEIPPFYITTNQHKNSIVNSSSAFIVDF